MPVSNLHLHFDDCQHVHIEVTKENSTKHCQMLGSEPYLKIDVKNLAAALESGVPKTAYFPVVLRQHMSANITGTKM